MYLKCMISVLAIGVATAAPDEARAFGFGDIVSIGIQAVGKVGGAVIDKALEDSPEEKEVKRQKEKADREAQFHKEIAKIEERPDLSPLDKERLTRQVSSMFGLAETFSNLHAQQELQRIKQRDQVLTVGGIAGVVGNAALNSPSVIMERADMAARSGLPQAQARGAIERADVMAKNGRQGQAAIEAVLQGGVQPSIPPGADGRIAESINGVVGQQPGEIHKAMAAIEAAKPKELPSVPEPANLAALDKGRKIYVEFVAGQKLTERLQLAFRNSGHNVVDSASDAEVVYQFDGEYVINQTSNRPGLTERIGVYIDNPHPIEAPKEQSSMKRAVGGFLATMAGIPAKQPSATTYGQAALVVANRRFNGQDTRISALTKKESGALEHDLLIGSALKEIIGTVGIDEPAVAVQIAEQPEAPTTEQPLQATHADVKHGFKIESDHALASDILPKDAFTSIYDDKDVAIAAAIEGVSEPDKQEVRVVELATGGVVWRSTEVAKE